MNENNKLNDNGTLSLIAYSIATSPARANEDKLLLNIYGDEYVTREEVKLLKLGYDARKAPIDQNEKVKQYIYKFI